jgi:hypothetical protein
MGVGVLLLAEVIKRIMLAGCRMEVAGRVLIVSGKEK